MEAASRYDPHAMKVPVAERYAIASISCGRDHTLALLDNGKALGWGGDGSGRIQSRALEYCSSLKIPARPVEVILRQELISVSAGHGTSLGITAQEQVVIWGATAVAVLTAARFFFRPGPKKEITTAVKMLSQDGKLVEVEVSNLPTKRKKITVEQLQNWIQKKTSSKI